MPGLRRGEVWVIHGTRSRLGLIVSSDIFNSTDVPIVVVAEVVERERLRDSPLAVDLGEDHLVLPDRLSSPLKVWFVELADVADTETMDQVSRALRTIQDI